MDKHLSKQSPDVKGLLQFLDELGWQIAMPCGGGEDDDGELKGMIIGEPGYIDYILKHLD